MRSSTLPTETVDDGQPSRPVPTEPTPSGIQDEKPPAERGELETLRRENEQADADIERLESEVDRLQRQIRGLEQSQQAVVDRYEGVIADLESAAAPQGPGTRTDGSWKSAERTTRTDPSTVFDRLSDWLF